MTTSYQEGLPSIYNRPLPERVAAPSLEQLRYRERQRGEQSCTPYHAAPVASYLTARSSWSLCCSEAQSCEHLKAHGRATV